MFPEDYCSFRPSEKLLQAVDCYIEENYVEKTPIMAYDMAEKCMENRHRLHREACEWSLREECFPLEAPVLLRQSRSLEEVLQEEDAGFTETLLKRIDQSGKKDSEIYKKAGLTKQHFSKIRRDPHYRPTKPTAISLALALELDLEATKDLIGRAGYALTNSSKFDLIIRYFIEQEKYNVMEINAVLFAYDQNLLGS